jgi:lysozyme family protein
VQTTPRPAYAPGFLDAVARVLVHEGGTSNNPADAGGLTRFGICSRDYPDLDIALLTRDDAVAIYYRDFWIPGRFDLIPRALGAKCFDLSVNIGVSHAVKCLQRAIRAAGEPIADDGVVGEKTAASVLRVPEDCAMAALRSEAAGYYRTIAALARGPRADGDREFLNGWLSRAYS